VITFFYATGLTKMTEGGGVGGEEIKVHYVHQADIPAWCRDRQRDGVLVDSKICAALYLARSVNQSAEPKASKAKGMTKKEMLMYAALGLGVVLFFFRKPLLTLLLVDRKELPSVPMIEAAPLAQLPADRLGGAPLMGRVPRTRYGTDSSVGRSVDTEQPAEVKPRQIHRLKRASDPDR
jgi:hypothetical protein